MNFVIVTGMSGAGKTTVLKFLEDIDFFCVDNLPPFLIPKFAEICYKPESDIKNIALGIDIRGGKLFNDLFSVLEELNKANYNYQIIFLNASDDVLINRYKETRRNHPLAKNKRVIDGIIKEKKILEEVKKKSDFIIDTSYILTRQLKEQINNMFLDNKVFNNLIITIMSFGFKYGMPNDSDLVFDVRFIPNPYYVSELKEKTGNDIDVKKYVLEKTISKEFLIKLEDMIKFLIPNYIKEGKNQLVISIGCTGGKHRSVVIVNEIYKTLQQIGNSVIINHRDIDKDTKRR